MFIILSPDLHQVPDSALVDPVVSPPFIRPTLNPPGANPIKLYSRNLRIFVIS